MDVDSMNDWLTTENLLTVVALLMARMNWQNSTITKLLKPLEKFLDKISGLEETIEDLQETVKDFIKEHKD